MTARPSIERADIIPIDEYAATRDERRRALREVKQRRRVAVGPDATFYFENYDTMWHQIHEMLYIEKGGEAQITDELEAYNPLVPKGRELVATLMFEIEDAARRGRILAGLGGVERTISLTVEGARIAAVPEDDVERTSAAGKASAVQFIHFPFTDPQIGAFRRPGARIVLAVEHPAYAHMAVLPEQIRAALAADFAQD
jgi:Protein of unknown function (DUF3501)